MASESYNNGSQSPQRSSRILIVDDEDATRRLLARVLEGQGYACTLAADAHEARVHLENDQFDLMLCDVNMPGESGLQLLKNVLREHPDTAAVMVTGLDDPQFANIALETGAYGYVIKPFESNEVLIDVANALRRRRLEIENRSHRDELEQMVLQRTGALRHALKGLEQAAEETIRRLAIAAEFRDDETARHIQRMSMYCALLARLSGLNHERCELIRIASPMHDIGKIGTPDLILLKPGKFTPEEFKVMTRHTEIGHRILLGSDAELLKLAATIAWTHHESFDGTGYPRGLVGEAIPLEGRIAAIADAFDALTSKRVYKPAYPVAQAVDLMQSHRGKQFDPALLDTFFGSINQVTAIRNQYADGQVAS